MKKTLLFVALLSPFLYLLWSVQLANDPIKYIYTYTGVSALFILVISLSASPLKRVLNFIRYRKMLGLFAFFYALLHFLTFFVLDAQFDLLFVAKETLGKPFVYLGMISFIMLFFMAITSRKKLFAKFSRYHKVVYLALILAVIHASMAQKVLSYLEYIFIVLVCALLTYKIYEKIRNMQARP